MNIQWIVLDVDGVLSDGTLIYTSTGEELKVFFCKRWFRLDGGS